jgi:hypothetical protein
VQGLTGAAVDARRHVVYAGSGRNYPPGDLRVSDADRDRALAELGEHFQAGRITAEEFEERSGQALSAKTGNDLRALLADLPVSQAPGTGMAQAPGSPVPMPRHRGVPVVAIAAVACGFLAVVALAGVLSTGGSQHNGWGAVIVPVVLLLVILRRLGHGAGGRRM